MFVGPNDPGRVQTVTEILSSYDAPLLGLLEELTMSDCSNPPSITAVICTYERYDVLVEALRSLEKQTLPKEQYELVVVDNSPSSEKKERFWEGLHLACECRAVLEDEPGLSRARNIGLDEARGRHIAFLDDDAVASPGWLEAAVTVLDERPKVGIVGGPVEPIWPERRPAWLHEWQEGYLTILDRGPDLRELGPAEWVAGTNMALRREVLQRAGGFDTAIGRIGRSLLSNEELALTKKLSALGYTSVYSPHMRVRHRVHADRLNQEWFVRRASWQAVSDLLSSAEAGSGDRSSDERTIERFFSSLPIRRRKFESFFAGSATKEEFQLRLSAVEALARLLLREERGAASLRSSA